MASPGQELLRQCSRSATATSLYRLSVRSPGRLHSIRFFQTATIRSGRGDDDGSPLKIGIWNHTLAHNFNSTMPLSLRAFAATAANVKTQPPLEQGSLTETVSESIGVQENALSELAEGYTPGEALLVLNLKRATVYPIEIVGLCNAARAGYPRDAEIIQTALREFKRTRNLLIDKEHAAVAVDGMLRALLPSSDVTAEHKMNAALQVLDLFLDTSSGLYFATPMASMDKVFSLLLEGVQEQNMPRANENEEAIVSLDTMESKRDIRKQLRKLRLLPTATPPKKSKDDEEEIDDSTRVARTTLQVVELLIQRKQRPYRLMKKRAARWYLVQSKIHHGPTPDTIKTCVKLVKQLRGPTVAMTRVVQPCSTARCPIPAELVQELEIAMKEEAEAVQAEKELEDTEDSGEESAVPEEELEKQD